MTTTFFPMIIPNLRLYGCRAMHEAIAENCWMQKQHTEHSTYATHGVVIVDRGLTTQC